MVDKMESCSDCGKVVNENVKDYSIKHFEKVLCYDCQKKQEPKKKEPKETKDPIQERIEKAQGRKIENINRCKAMDWSLQYICSEKYVGKVSQETIEKTADKFLGWINKE